MAGETDIEVKQGNVDFPSRVVETIGAASISESNRKDEMMNENNSMVKLAGVVGGSSVGIVTVFAIFAREQMTYAAIIVGSLCLMGVILGGLSRKCKPKE